ncbi:hypothetical protein [Pseudomarimonas arenosa]|uniref:Lipoprotein n=1 Tax=Pseudomarimonas arenosa TaxID=2774145 RepID=A0AAW3ZJ74_9GAMM|nr:hypothetical protein [Pseudomarimonas arenosa]MBD8525833.1 hypothetical protein [Pseudomarimonas arenosa]
MNINSTAICLALLCICSTAAASGIEYRGEARATDSGNLLYAEHHYLRTEGGRPRERLVMYRCPSGEAFARKTVSYGEPPYAPSFRMDDARLGYAEGFSRGKAAGEALVQRASNQPAETDAISLGESLVVDAGFDEFVRSHWEELQAGKKVSLRFLVPSRLAAYGFKLQKTGEENLYGESASTFRLALSGLFGWFADAIDVSYRNSDRRLMRFVGLSNIRASADENLVADIQFPPAEQRDALDDGRWQQAEQEPLVACQLGR